MPRDLDHIVHAVRDLDAAAAFYSGAGLRSGPATAIPGARTTGLCS